MTTTIFPYCLERKTNVKKEKIQELSNEEILFLMDQLIETRRIQLENAADSIRILEHEYSLNQDPDILKAKRKMMNGKVVTNIKEDFSKVTIDTIEKYNEKLIALGELEKEFDDYYFARMQENRVVLQTFIKNNDLVQKALPLINKDFHCKLEKYLEVPVQDHNAKIRKLDHQIIRLMTRATMKTSPFSYLTSVCLYDLDEKQEQQEQLLHSECEMNAYIMKAIYDKLISIPWFAKQISYRLNAYKEYDKNCVFLYQRDYEKGKVYKTVDGTIQCKKNQLLDFLMKAYGKNAFAFGELVSQLTKSGIDEETANNYIYENLIQKNFITPALSVDETKENVFEDFYQKCSGFQDNDEKILEQIISYVKRYEELILHFYSAKAKERFQMVNEMDSLICQVEKLLGQEFVHNILVYEDTFYDNPKKPFTTSMLEQYDFSELQKFFQLFDQSILTYELFSENFYKVYGTEKMKADDLDVYQLFVRTSSMLNSVWKDNFSEVSVETGQKIQKITAMKKKIFAKLTECKEKGSMQDISEYIEELIRENDDVFTQEIDSATLFLQQAEDGNLVLNKVYKGQLVFFSRFLKKQNKSRAKLKSYCEKAFGDNPAEITESFGFNANVHDRLFEKRLVLPLTDQNDHTEQDIDISECYFYYDTNKHLVKLGHEKYGEINGVFLGSLAYNLMPIPLRTINGMQPTTRFDYTFLNFWNTEEQEKLIADHMPRIQYKNIVLIREQFLINSIYDLKKPSEELYKTILEDFRKNNLPTRFFIRPYINGSDFDFYNMGRTSLKPQYMDLSSPLLFQELLREMEIHQQFVIEELYPDNKEDDYIYEYEIERTVRRGGEK